MSGMADTKYRGIAAGIMAEGNGEPVAPNAPVFSRVPGLYEEIEAEYGEVTTKLVEGALRERGMLGEVDTFSTEMAIDSDRARNTQERTSDGSEVDVNTEIPVQPEMSSHRESSAHPVLSDYQGSSPSMDDEGPSTFQGDASFDNAMQAIEDAMSSGEIDMDSPSEADITESIVNKAVEVMGEQNFYALSAGEVSGLIEGRNPNAINPMANEHWASLNVAIRKKIIEELINSDGLGSLESIIRDDFLSDGHAPVE